MDEVRRLSFLFCNDHQYGFVDGSGPFFVTDEGHDLLIFQYDGDMFGSSDLSLHGSQSGRFFFFFQQSDLFFYRRLGRIDLQ